jgi:ABC-2 type transport system permease protein
MFAMGVSGMAFAGFADAAVPGEMPEALLEVLGGAENIVAGYLSYMALFMAPIVAIYAVLAMQGMRAEETGGRGEPVLATPVSRWAWLGSNLVVSAVGVLLIMTAAGLGAGLAATSVTGDAKWLGNLTVAHLNHVPAILVVLGLAGLLFGAAPRLQGLTWGLIGYGFIAATFGRLMNLPEWALGLSPFDHAASMPLEAFELAPVAILTAIAAALAAVGLIAFRKRGINIA